MPHNDLNQRKTRFYTKISYILFTPTRFEFDLATRYSKNVPSNDAVSHTKNLNFFPADNTKTKYFNHVCACFCCKFIIIHLDRIIP